MGNDGSHRGVGGSGDAADPAPDALADALADPLADALADDLADSLAVSSADHEDPRGAPGDDDFAPEELAMLRELFRDEAQEALEQITNRLLGASPISLGDDAVTELMRITHTLKGSAGTVGLPLIVTFAHELEDHFARLGTGRLHWSGLVLDQFVEVVDALRTYVDGLDTPTSHTLLTRRIEDHLRALRLLGGADEQRTRPIAAPTAGPAAAPSPSEVSDGVVAPYEHMDDTTRSIVAGVGLEDWRRDGQGVLRVAPSRIDLLMDSVGELIFDRTRIERRVQSLHRLVHELRRTCESLHGQTQRIGHAEPAEHMIALGHIEDELGEHVEALRRHVGHLLDDTDALRRTSTGLQTGLTRVRMSSARTLFQTLSRQLRAIARGAGKKVQLITSGADTEFDKTVAERITDPLIQLLRNAVAHGIEPERIRLTQGKSAEGEIRIDARQEGSLVVIDISDDGTGIDPDALRERFVAAGHWSRARANLATDEDVLHAIFDVGVSTRDEADYLAGRGVGLDTVRETIARLGGEIRMTSTPGKGTHFTMRLPVSTAVSQALLFKVYRDVYAVPNVHVLETVQVERIEDDMPAYIEVRGSRVPLLYLQDILESSSPVEMPVMPAIVLEYAGKRMAVTCDKLVGPREIVVKDLGPLLSPLPLYAGATISGSGKVQLILDPAALVRMAHPGSLPHQGPAHASATTAAISELSDARAATGRALVADDSRAIREALTSILVSSGYVVESAENGAHAWALAQSTEYDLIITDIEMPIMDGFSLVERIRNDDRLMGVPIIIVSSRNTTANRERARRLSVRSFVQKPVTRRKLLGALKSL